MTKRTANSAIIPANVARAAGVYYVNDGDPGLLRVPAGNGFRLRRSDGQSITDRRLHERIKHLAIPPAWTDVWICASPRGHIQAMGRDARGRKQYIYHAEWRSSRDRAKFDRLLDFGRALPKIRARIGRDLARRSLSKERVLAAIVRLLDMTHVRVGNEEYARCNGSFGLTTLRDHHVTVTPTALTFVFRAKSGKPQRVYLSDRRLARIVKACQDLPGQQLFQYLDRGMPRSVTSGDVNAYLRRISGDEFTAKDFRTWAGTVLAGGALCELGTCDGVTASRRNISAAVKRVAARLGNTAAICRKSYIHPAVIAAYQGGSLPARHGPPTRGLSADESAILKLLSRTTPRPAASRSFRGKGPAASSPPSPRRGNDTPAAVL